MKILYMAPIGFTDLKQRPQYIAELLARDHEVWYIEPTVSIMKYLLKGGRTYKWQSYDVSPNLHIQKLDGRFSMHISLQAMDFFRLNSLYERKQLKESINQCDMIWIGYCGWYDVIAGVQGKKIVYDKMDEDTQITQNKLLARYLRRAEPRLIKKADTIFVTAKKFYEKITKIKDRVYYVPNGFHRELGQRVDFAEKKNSHRRIFGYVGALEHWLDIEIIETIVNADCNNYVILVGPNHIPMVKHERISYVGRVPKTQVGDYIQFFDVCLFPFKKNDFLDTVDPVKIYEYLVFNKPILAIDSVETRKFGELVIRYSSRKELLEKLKMEFKPPFLTNVKRMVYLEENAWEKRMDIILEKIMSR